MAPWERKKKPHVIIGCSDTPPYMWDQDIWLRIQQSLGLTAAAAMLETVQGEPSESPWQMFNAREAVDRPVPCAGVASAKIMSSSSSRPSLIVSG